MIYRLNSDCESFKNLVFHDGFNVLLSKRTKTSSDRDTRNRVGKSSMVRIVDFLFGAEPNRQSLFRSDVMADTTFGITFDLGGTKTEISRQGANPNVVNIVSADTADWPVSPTTTQSTGQITISNRGWCAVLGGIMFRMSLTDDARSTEPSGPTFRMVFPYFARRIGSHGFDSVIEHSASQALTPWQSQVALSFLLDLDSTIPSRFEQVRLKERDIDELRKSLKKGVLEDIIGNAAALRSEITVLEDKCRKESTALGEFKVLPQYRSLERESTEITRKMARLSDENKMDMLLIAEVEESLRSQAPPDLERLTRLYDEAGSTLPTIVVRRFEEVLAFHQSVLRNRESYLNGEVEEARDRIKEREKRYNKFSGRQSEIMNLLDAHSALDQFQKMQKELTKGESNLESKRQQYEIIQKIGDGKDTIEEERRGLKRLLEQDFQERSEMLKKAVLYFEEASSCLYLDPGVFTYAATSRGPKFGVSIHGQESEGIKNMQIFCFDMMIMRLCKERGIGPDFLIHDSHLFDPVDERQVARALEYGARLAASMGFQYIVTLNEDKVPTDEFTNDFDFYSYALPVVLTDEREDGGLFGFQFE